MIADGLVLPFTTGQIIFVEMCLLWVVLVSSLAVRVFFGQRAQWLTWRRIREAVTVVFIVANIGMGFEPSLPKELRVGLLLVTIGTALLLLQTAPHRPVRKEG